MSRLISRQSFQPSCPGGGTWYSCGHGSKFVGCCRSEACENGCPAGNLEPASFDPSYYGKFPDQECSAGQWYSCGSTNPPFLGCCKTNVCSLGSCPDEDLAGGFLSNNPAIANPFSPTGGPVSSSSTTTPSSTASSSATSSGTSASATTLNVAPTSGSSSNNAPSASHHLPIGAIIGAAIGGAVVIGLIVSMFKLYRSFARSRALHQGGTAPDEFLQTPITHSSPDKFPKAFPSPPPRYSMVPPPMIDLSELAGSPGHKRHASELSAVSLPAELDSGSNSPTIDGQRWAQHTALTGLTQAGGLHITSIPDTSQFPSQSQNFEGSLDRSASNSQGENLPPSPPRRAGSSNEPFPGSPRY